MDPTAERVELPEGYGTATTTMEWGAARERLEQAPRYWLVTTRATAGLTWSRSTGAGWTTPGGTAAARARCTSATWSTTGGSWSTSRTRWPRSSWRARWSGVVPPAEQAGRLKAASEARYGHGPPEAAYAAGLWALRPERARAWSAFPTDVTRLRFG